MNNETERILTNIRKIREAQGLSQDYIGEFMGISNSAFCKIEKGETILKYEALSQIAKAFGLRTIDLITYPAVYVDEAERPELKKIRASLNLELDQDKIDQILKLVLEDSNFEILKK